MSQTGGVNILDAINPAAAGNAIAGASAAVDRAARQKLANQQSLDQAAQSFASSITQALERNQAQQMQQEKIAAEQGMQRE